MLLNKRLACKPRKGNTGMKECLILTKKNSLQRKREEGRGTRVLKEALPLPTADIVHWRRACVRAAFPM